MVLRKGLIGAELLALCAAMPASATDYTRFTFLAEGTVTCPDWVMRRKNSGLFGPPAETGWVMGFISGYNALVAVKIDELTAEVDKEIEKDNPALLKQLEEEEAKNPREVNITKGFKAQQIFAWIDQYCAAHPLEDLNKATRNLIRELEDRTGVPHQLPEMK
jgi:hypothetical protein